ncbi:MAG: GGDEF domain-containing protein [Chloracidobacterium sp.]|nr:GGDEF domain-containing protein [Chloracidobacterium sp.]
MDSKIGLIIQIAGVSLITLLTLFLRRSLNLAALKYWTNAWLFLSFSLFCLRLAFDYDGFSYQLFGFYFLAQYFFGYLLVAGCRSLRTNSELRLSTEIFAIPFILAAFSLPFLSEDVTLTLKIHSVIMSGFFAIAFFAVWQSGIKSFGSRVMLVALGLLIIDLAQSLIVFTLRPWLTVPAEYLGYNAVADLVLQTLLGFGMVIVLLEKVLSDVKTANERLREAHEKLEELAHIDPLTTALNRHAFHGYLATHGDGSSGSAGCVGFFDIDDLKELNDVYGHAAGDAAIRAVVRAIRNVIRAEDLIFRWGGDEFFVIMIGLRSEAALCRMSRMNGSLSSIILDGVYQPITIRVSHAFEDFANIAEIEAAIEKADAKMYLQKQEHKRLSPQALTAEEPAELTV